ncbi:DUF6281 family protein [Streptomyces sp. NBC_00988]|uniref:DUF6281 family protein n=1 Tax=Streptomyces sp. NBC_00988 TaxID=2903704 RepID=UPI00386FA7B2
MQTGCGGLWPRCRYRGLSMAGWSWPSTSPAGFGPTPIPACDQQLHDAQCSGKGPADRDDQTGAATLPSCDDTRNDDSDGQTAPTSTVAYEIKGVDPSLAIAVEQSSDDVIFVNVDSDKQLPEIKRLIHGS